MEKKKMSVKKRVLLSVLLVLLIIVLAIVIHTMRNFLIIKNLQNNFSKYSDSTNYHVRTVSTQENGLVSSVNYYKKDKKQVMILERNDADQYAKISIYNNGERIDMFTETKDEKTATLDTNRGILTGGLSNDLGEESVGSHLFVSLMAKIRKENLNGKECYKISNFLSGNFMSEDENDEYYFEKETGFLLQNNFGTTQIVKEYEFDNVDDSIFIEPNIGEYKLNIAE